MFRLTKWVKFIIFLVIIYSLYVKMTIPSITEGFTSDMKENFRPKVRRVRNMINYIYMRLFHKYENFRLKNNR